jgi:hypothetical protein
MGLDRIDEVCSGLTAGGGASGALSNEKAAQGAASKRFLTSTSLVANANVTYHPLTPLINMHSSTNVTVGLIVIDGRRDGDAETGEEPLMVMVMVMVVLHEPE